MLKKCLIATIFLTLVFSSLSMAQIDKIAIFNELVGWTTVEAAAEATEVILANVTSASSIEVLNDEEMGAFAEANTGDGNLDIIVTFGYWPVSLYPPGNAEPDGSVGELFLEGGDMIMNTADYIFYVTQGGGANGDAGLKNMTDSEFDLWTDNTEIEPTADGEKYLPSLEPFTSHRAFVIAQVEENPDWEFLAIFGTNGDNADPAIIQNLTYGGLVGINHQVSDDTMPRGPVMAEMIEYIGAIGGSTAVEPAAKLATSWGAIK
ncbi:hypothetical protein GF312_13900 [Candidatus Poribacteria bacterium]|nr:hypothetical protein [Candidatus Poribacteria bacterium]